MSLSLPQLPNLDHLKKQAKDALNLVHRHKPGWKLADAQHAVARGYGFASWPKLKAHVDAVQTVDRTRAVVRTAAGTDDEVQGTPSIAGIWIARTSPPDSVILKVAAAGDIITITQVALDASGREVAATMALRADGLDHPSERGGQIVRSTWIRPDVLQVEHKQGPHVLARGTYEVSQEGSTLSVSMQEQVIVFDRA
jgi:hypothetical protein